jgi:hypothetical protein
MLNESPRRVQQGTVAADNVRYAPFVYDAWKNPETLRIVSGVAGIDLTVQFDFEIGHINLSFKTEEQKERELELYNQGQGAVANVPGDDKPIVDWHTDSYPFVCVTMLSDCSSMKGGETALRMGSGEILKVRGPQMVSLQQRVHNMIMRLRARRMVRSSM